MKNKLPKTLVELNTVVKNRSSKPLLNEEGAPEMFGKYTYDYSDLGFILSSHKVTDSLIRGRRNFREGGEIAAHKHIIKNAKNEFMGYKFAHILKMKTPEHYWIPDHKNKTYNIVTSFIEGERPKNYLNNPENKKHIKTMKENIGRILTNATLLGYYDLHDDNFMIENHQPIFFDFDQSLNASTCWDKDPEINKDDAIELLDNFLNIIPESAFSIRYLMEDITHQDILTGFQEAKENLNNASSMHYTACEKEIYQGLHDRADACITHLKLKL